MAGRAAGVMGCAVSADLAVGVWDELLRFWSLPGPVSGNLESWLFGGSESGRFLWQAGCELPAGTGLRWMS